MFESIRQAWAAIEDDQLHGILAAIDRPAPPQWKGFYLGSLRIGWLAPGHVAPLMANLPSCEVSDRGLVWQAAHWDAGTRTQALARAAQALKDSGWVGGWRNELYSYWGEIEHAPQPQQPHHFALERAAFRFFGLRSHAVHINGFTPDGRLWCGIRSMGKATDPGRIDNLAAGGLPAGEEVLSCAIRELYEEAGLPPELAQRAQPAGRIVTRRCEPQGWHDEALLVYNLLVPSDVVPMNVDGEVSGFLCLTPQQAMRRIGEMTEDAAGVLAQGVLSLRATGRQTH